MADIRFQVNAQNINVKKLWQTKGYQKQLNESEFKDFIKAIVPNIQIN